MEWLGEQSLWYSNSSAPRRCYTHNTLGVRHPAKCKQTVFFNPSGRVLRCSCCPLPPLPLHRATFLDGDWDQAVGPEGTLSIREFHHWLPILQAFHHANLASNTPFFFGAERCDQWQGDNESILTLHSLLVTGISAKSGDALASHPSTRRANFIERLRMGGAPFILQWTCQKTARPEKCTTVLDSFYCFHLESSPSALLLSRENHDKELQEVWI